MSNLIFEEALKELNELDDDDFVDPDVVPISEEEEAFATDVYNMLSEFIPTELDEKFTSEGSAEKHFYKHCLAESTDKKSTKTTIYYDFSTLRQYKSREQLLHRKCKAENVLYIDSLYEIEYVLRCFRKLFEGNKTLVISQMCGLKSSEGLIALAFNAFSTDVTENYKAGNTLDLIIKSKDNKTITFYPIDAYHVESKFNNIIAKYSDLELEFHINH